MQSDSGLLDDKTPEEVTAYMEDLGLKFEYYCIKENDPVSCHSLAQWYETYKHNNSKCTDVLKSNCFDKNFADSCRKYSYFRLVGKPDVSRDAVEAYRALEHCCNKSNDSQCCHGAARLVAEGIASHTASFKAALPLFEKACTLGFSASCFHWGGAAMMILDKLEKQTEHDSIESSVKELNDLKKVAFKAWFEGCRLGHEHCCRNVAMMYAKGDGVEVNESKANEFITLADQISKKQIKLGSGNLKQPA